MRGNQDQMPSIDHTELMNAIGYNNSDSSSCHYSSSVKIVSDKIFAVETPRTQQKSFRDLGEFDLNSIVENDYESKVSP